ncbi:hypothetical protein EMIT0215P_110126 [Pseudomonas serboccidentalis]
MIYKAYSNLSTERSVSKNKH